MDDYADLKHELARACLALFGLKGVEITSISDIPGSGSGLGSSSSYTVGLLNAISTYCGKRICSPHLLAEEAFLIEFGCGHSVGKQDHYAASHGGLHFFKFTKDGNVEVEPIILGEEDSRLFQDQLLLFWTGKTRKANDILKQQDANLLIRKRTQDVALDMRDLAFQLRNSLQLGGIYTLGEYLHNNWVMKKELALGISDHKLDLLYEKARTAGATGGKICGAGGGGFLLISAEQECHEAIEKAIGLRRVPFKMELEGSKIIYG